MPDVPVYDPNADSVRKAYGLKPGEVFTKDKQKAGDAYFKTFFNKNDNPAASADNYIRNLRVLQMGLRATAAGLINPAAMTAATRILTERGMASDELGKALASGALTISYNEGTVGAGAAAEQLSDFQTSVEQARQAATASRSGTPSTGVSIALGAAEGFAVGGPVGAAFGAAAGYLGSRKKHKDNSKIKRAIDEAGRLASPENLQANLGKVQAAMREQTFLAGQEAQLATESAVSRGGLRGTGVGTQASIGASVTPEVLALRSSIGRATDITGNEVSAKLGSTVRPSKTTLVDALGAAAGVTGALLTPEARAKRAAKRSITGGESYSDTIGPNIYQPTVGEV